VTFSLIEAIGIVAFGVSGVLVARRRHLDAYGALFLALVAALGGGTLRDMILGRTPPVNLVSPVFVALAVSPALVLFIVGRIVRDGTASAAGNAIASRALLIADAIGLSSFTVSGTSVALATDSSGLLAVMCGVITATGGGMMRDLLAGVVPAVLRREIYAVASLVGAVSVVIAATLGVPENMWGFIGGLLTFVLRIGTHSLRLHLPTLLGSGGRHVAGPDGPGDGPEESGASDRWYVR